MEMPNWTICEQHGEILKRDGMVWYCEQCRTARKAAKARGDELMDLRRFDHFKND